jgi:hypothetical protein
MGMLLAKSGAAKFLAWLSDNEHFENYPHLGNALMSWLENDGGVIDLKFDYGTFLQMVMVLLEDQKLNKGVSFRVDGSEKILKRPIGTDWLPDHNDFYAIASDFKDTMNRLIEKSQLDEESMDEELDEDEEF